MNWEEQFARGGVGAVLSSHVPIHVRGRVLPNYALIDDDDKVPFWRTVGERVHAHGCAFLLQLSHSGRRRDIAGVENADNIALSSTNTPDPVHGLPAQAMTEREIDDVVASSIRSSPGNAVDSSACPRSLRTTLPDVAAEDIGRRPMA